jgi:hypothetical protein
MRKKGEGCDEEEEGRRMCVMKKKGEGCDEEEEERGM